MPFSHQIKSKREATPNSSNKVSICLQELLPWIFLFHCRVLTSSANLYVASTSVRSQQCFNVIVQISHLQVPLLVYKGMGTLSHTKKMYSNVVPTRSHSTTPWSCDKYNMQRQLAGIVEFMVRVQDHGLWSRCRVNFKVEGFSSQGFQSQCLD